MYRSILAAVAVSTSLAFSGVAMAQGAPPAYGMPISIDQAKKAAAAAVAEATKNNWGLCITVVAPSGDLVYFEKMDNCQYASITISQHKARTAATYRRPTKVFQDAMQKSPSNLNLLTLDGIIASDGGYPIVVGGKIIGAIGASGATGAQDGQAAQAGVAALQ
jgi:glc operon protein GlcG